MEFFWIHLSALGLGFLGGAHCIGMCGGIMAALSFATPNQSRLQRWKILLAYNAGRITSYMLIAVLASSLLLFSGGAHSISVLRIIAGLLLVAMGFYLGNWWRGLTYLELGGRYLWRYIQPLGKRLMPVKNAPQAFLLGALWGWLPCGLIYSALTYAAAQTAGSNNILLGATIMLAFGLGTLPAVLASGVFAERIKALMQSRNIRTVFALAIIVFGLWTIFGTLGHSIFMDHSQHQNMDHGQSLDHSQHQNMNHDVPDMPDSSTDHSHHQHH